MFRILLFIFIFFLLLNSVNAQTDSVETSDSSMTFNLSIKSNLNSARIFLDTVYIGYTPLTDYKVIPGDYKLKIINPNPLNNWENENKIYDISISKDTTITADFKYYYLINTNPFNAKVLKNDSLLGDTPLRFYSNEKLSGTLLLKKKNFKDYYFDLASYNFETGANINLIPKGKETINDVVYKNKGTQFKTKRNLPAILALSAATIAGAYFAIDFKDKANEDYNKYLVTRNQQNLDSSNQNDTYFVVSLVLMQAAVGGLIYFLFFD